MIIEIKTRRLLLRQVDLSDLDDIAKLHADPDVMKFFPGGTKNRVETEERLKEFLSFYKDKNLPGFVILDGNNGEFIGRCGFGPHFDDVEVGYLIAKKFWGAGYATEVLNALLDWSKKNIDKKYIIAFAPLNHKASLRVMEKCGMQYYKSDIGYGLKCIFYKIKNST